MFFNRNKKNNVYPWQPRGGAGGEREIGDKGRGSYEIKYGNAGLLSHGGVYLENVGEEKSYITV